MGYNSNRPYTREEKLAKYAKDVINANSSQSRWVDNWENFQSTTGARIRGELGEKRGNEFIEAMRKISR